MGEQHLGINPENWFHYQHLRRDRAFMRRQGYVLLVAAGALLVGMVLVGSVDHSGRLASLVPLALFLGFAVLLVSNGLVMLRRSRQPISDGEVARRRQEERQQLFQFAQGHISWRYWLVVAIQGVIGLIFLSLGMWAAWSLVANRANLDPLDLLLGFAFVVVGWYSLFRGIGRARLLRRLARVSSQELAARLSLGEATEGESHPPAFGE